MPAFEIVAIGEQLRFGPRLKTNRLPLHPSGDSASLKGYENG
jgi:hypothetical protein